MAKDKFKYGDKAVKVVAVSLPEETIAEADEICSKLSLKRSELIVMMIRLLRSQEVIAAIATGESQGKPGMNMSSC